MNYHDPIFGPILGPADTRRYYQTLLQQIPWKHDEAVIFGKHIVTARMVAWYGDSNFSCTCSGTTKQALAWTAELAALKATVGKLTAATFNSRLLNLYQDGSRGMGWHSDYESSLGRNSTVASVRLGAEWEFRFARLKVTE